MAVTVKGTLTLDTASFSKALKGALTTANLISSAIIGTFNRITGGFKNLAKGIFDAASEMEQFKFSFEALLGSAEKAQKKMAEVAAFSNSTRFDLKDVAEASRNLEILTRGALSGEKGLRLIGDTAAGLQKPFQDVAYAVGELFDTLSKGGDAASELENLRTMGAITQKGAGQINALSKGGPESAAKAWKLATQELEKYKGKAASQGQTWEGVTSRFNNTIRNAFRGIGTPLMKSLEPVISNMAKKLVELTPIFEKWGKKLADSVEPVTKYLENFFNNPGAALNNFGDTFQRVLVTAITKAMEVLESEMVQSLQTPISDTIANAITYTKTNGTEGAGSWVNGMFKSAPLQATRDLKLQHGMPTNSSWMSGTQYGGMKDFAGSIRPAHLQPIVDLARQFGKRGLGGTLFEGFVNKITPGRVLPAGDPGKESHRGFKFEPATQRLMMDFTTKNDAFFGKKSMLSLVESAQRVSGTFGGFQNRFTNQSLMGAQGNKFGSSLDIDAKRTTSLLSFNERRRFDMARRAAVRAANGGRRPEGDTLVRRGDRARARTLQKEALRQLTEAEKQTKIQQEVLALFAKFAGP